MIKFNCIKLHLETNLPMMNISYYEAKAFCKWANVRLPYEHEYEYVATNGGTTKYPWGNTDNKSYNCNINYIDFLVKPQKQDLAPKGEQIFVCEPEDIHVQVEVIK